jgi:hypothetical protein
MVFNGVDCGVLRVAVQPSRAPRLWVIRQSSFVIRQLKRSGIADLLGGTDPFIMG